MKKQIILPITQISGLSYSISPNEHVYPPAGSIYATEPTERVMKIKGVSLDKLLKALESITCYHGGDVLIERETQKRVGLGVFRLLELIRKGALKEEELEQYEKAWLPDLEKEGLVAKTQQGYELTKFAEEGNYTLFVCEPLTFKKVFE
jgi:hypothetical protein